ncbi:MAG TPA: hypothetical protein VLF94_00245, partial [Chlamydiales bacterium]|nr:hypothetical protein [Chlamydiales bacterium]
MRCLLLFFASVQLLGAPIKVPNDQFYRNFVRFDGHPGHAPLVSDMTFRAHADWVIDQSTESFDPDGVKLGDTIYLGVWYLTWFVTQVHDQIKYPYILITIDVDSTYPNDIRFRKLLYDPKLAAWFGRCLFFSYHPKLFQIPFGQSWYYFSDVDIPYLAELSKKQPFPKKHLLYMNH